jgi:hypothetical protein
VATAILIGVVVALVAFGVLMYRAGADAGISAIWISDA